MRGNSAVLGPTGPLLGRFWLWRASVACRELIEALSATVAVAIKTRFPSLIQPLGNDCQRIVSEGRPGHAEAPGAMDAPG